MTKLMWVGVLALMACSETNKNPTKAGTTVVTWQLADSERTTIRAAKQSDVKVADLDYEEAVDFDKKVVVKVNVHLETATVVFEEDGKQVEHRAPVKLEVTAVDANGFTLSQSRCMGPHYTLELPPGRDMILHCYVHARKPRYDVGLTIYAYGDGHIDNGTTKTQKIR